MEKEMSQLIEAAAQQQETREEFRTQGITAAIVISNTDLTKQGRVQVRIPWLPDIDPWVRVSVPMAGDQRGTYFIPQEDDEVLVAFGDADFRDAFVIGSLWNGEDKPPATELTDPVTKRLIRSPKGLLIQLDDGVPSITLTIKSSAKVKVGPGTADLADAGQNQAGNDSNKDVVPFLVIDKKSVTIKRSSGANQDKDEQIVTLSDDGIRVEVKKGNIVLKAKDGDVQIEAKNIRLKSNSETEIKAKGNCIMKGRQVQIN